VYVSSGRASLVLATAAEESPESASYCAPATNDIAGSVSSKTIVRGNFI
jgi:hypothetical protein